MERCIHTFPFQEDGGGIPIFEYLSTTDCEWNFNVYVPNSSEGTATMHLIISRGILYFSFLFIRDAKLKMQRCVKLCHRSKKFVTFSVVADLHSTLRLRQVWVLLYIVVGNYLRHKCRRILIFFRKVAVQYPKSCF